MADPSQQNDDRSENYYRERYFHPSNRPYRGRGRGRDYRVDNVERALSELGVRDLREHLDRKHQYEQSRGGPPSDPAYNYLKDPLRENEDNHGKVHVSPLLRSNSHRGRGRSRYEEDTFIQNPMNIKVELSTSTGQRSYSLNEKSKLADIKHIPDYEQSQRGGFVRGRGSRGKGRGKYGNDQPAGEQVIRSKSTERRRNFEVGNHSRSKSVEHKGEGRNSTNDSESNSKFVSETVENRGRGRTSSKTIEYASETVENRGRGRTSSKTIEYASETVDNRGRGRNTYEYVPENQKTRGLSFESWENRGRGRGRGRRWNNRRGRGNHQRQAKPDTDYVQPANSNVATEENWDNEDTSEKYNVVVDRPYNPEPEFKDDEDNVDLPEGYSEDISIVVKASDEGNDKKRTVRFSLNENNEENKDKELDSYQNDDNIQ